MMHIRLCNLNTRDFLLRFRVSSNYSSPLCFSSVYTGQHGSDLFIASPHYLGREHLPPFPGHTSAQMHPRSHPELFSTGSVSPPKEKP